MAVETSLFFEHIDAFFDYRKTIYNASEQTQKSNRTDLNLFQRFISNKNHQDINGQTAMAFQYHLKNDRDIIGGSIIR